MMGIEQTGQRGAFKRFWDSVLGPVEDQMRQRKYAALRTEIENFLAATDPEVLSQNMSTCADMIAQGVDNKQLNAFLDERAPGKIGKAVVLMGGIQELNRRSTDNVRTALSSLKEPQSGHHRQLDPDTERVVSQIGEILGDLDQNQSDAIEQLMAVVNLTRTSLSEVPQRE